MNNLRQTFTRRWRDGIVAAVAVVALSAATWTVQNPAAQTAIPLGKVTTAAAPAISGRTTPDSYADLVAQVAPAVVTIRSERRVRQTQLPDDDLFRRFFGERGPQMPTPRREGGLGSGAIVSQDGYVLTNNHVIEQADQIKVELHDRRVVNAKLVGADAPSDLAVLKIEASGLKSLPLADSDRARVGDVVLAIGNPLGVGQTVTMGIISATGRATGLGEGNFEDFLQTDAPINQGNSGGPLINTRGELIGINSQILSPSGGNIGIGFAIPASMARSVMDQLVKTGTVKRGMLGVTIQPVTSDIAASLGLSEVRGAIVSDVTAGSPADKAGVKRGDVITKLDGEPISDSNTLRNHVARLQPGSKVTLTVLRNGQERSIAATLGELPSKREASANSEGSSDSGRFGMNVKNLTAEEARELGLTNTRGVVVSEVDPNGVAASAGIRAGDVIEEVNRKPVDNVNELKAALDASGKRPALLLVNRNGSERFVALTPRA